MKVKNLLKGKRGVYSFMAGALVALLLLAGLPACAPAAEEEVTPPAEGGGIQYGGRLNVGWLNCVETVSLDESIGYWPMAWTWWRLVYDRVGREGIPPDYIPEPQLIVKWETEDNKTWIAHLREDATFHDGVPVTAEDLAFTLTDFFEAEPRWRYSDCDCVPGSVKIIDDYTLEFTLKTVQGAGRYPPFWDSPIVPKHIWEPYFEAAIERGDPISEHGYANEDCIGSGPFKLKEFVPAEYMLLEANDDYYEKPYVDELLFKTYGSADALYMALRNGEIDMIGHGGCSRLVIDDFKEEGFKLITSRGVEQKVLSFNLHQDTPLGQDVNVRKAIMYGIDRDSIVDMVYLGYGETIDSIVYEEMPIHNPNLPQYDYDPDKANGMLDAAGYIDTDNDTVRNDPATGKNLAFVLMVNANNTDDVKAGTMITDYLQSIGIDISEKTLDTSTFGSFLYAPKEDQFDIAITMMDPGPGNSWVWEWFESYEAGGTVWNSSYYNNSVLDELYIKLSAESDEAKSTEYWYELQEIMAEDLPYGPLWRADVIDPVSDKFEGYVPAMGGISSWTNQWSYLKVHLK